MRLAPDARRSGPRVHRARPSRRVASGRRASETFSPFVFPPSRFVARAVRFPAVHLPRQPRVGPRRAHQLERRGRAPALARVRGLQQAGPHVRERGGGRRHVGRRRDPRQARVLPRHLPAPSFEPRHAHVVRIQRAPRRVVGIGTDEPRRVEQKREFPEGHAVPYRHGDARDERPETSLDRRRALRDQTAQRVGAIQNDDPNASAAFLFPFAFAFASVFFSRRSRRRVVSPARAFAFAFAFASVVEPRDRDEQVVQAGEVRVEPRAHVLHVEHHAVDVRARDDARERRRVAARLVRVHHARAGSHVARLGDGRVPGLFLAPEAVLGREHRAHVHGRARVQHVHDVSPRARTHAGVVGEHADARHRLSVAVATTPAFFFRLQKRCGTSQDVPALRLRHLKADQHAPRPPPREPSPERVRRDRRAHRDAPGEHQRGGDHDSPCVRARASRSARAEKIVPQKARGRRGNCPRSLARFERWKPPSVALTLIKRFCRRHPSRACKTWRDQPRLKVA